MGANWETNTYYRAYTKYFDWGPSVYPSGMTAHDGWDSLRGGFRADWTPAGANSLTLQGDVYRTRFDETLTTASLSAPYSNTFPNDGQYTGGNILGRWESYFRAIFDVVADVLRQHGRLATTLFSATTRTYWTSISSTGFTLAIHNNSYGGWATAQSTDKNNPSFTVSLTTQPSHSEPVQHIPSG